MRNSIINCIACATILVILISFSSCTNKKKNGTTSVSTEKLKEELTDLQYQEDKAESDKDFATLDKILSKDITIDLVADIHKFHIPNRDSFYAILRSTPADTSAYKQPLFENIKVTTSGDESVMDYLVTFYDSSQDVESMPNQYHNVVKWIKVNGQWQTVAVQSSSIPRKKE